jgi:hypothetical protein
MRETLHTEESQLPMCGLSALWINLKALDVFSFFTVLLKMDAVVWFRQKIAEGTQEPCMTHATIFLQSDAIGK